MMLYQQGSQRQIIRAIRQSSPWIWFSLAYFALECWWCFRKNALLKVLVYHVCLTFFLVLLWLLPSRLCTRVSGPIDIFHFIIQRMELKIWHVVFFRLSLRTCTIKLIMHNWRSFSLKFNYHLCTTTILL